MSGFDSDFLLTAQPYLGNSPVGEAITIIVYKQYPQVDGYFELLDPETGGVIQTGIVDKQQIELGSGKAFNFEAEFENIQYDSIRYSTSTGFEHTERYEPRPACGDSGSGFNDCSSLPGFESEFVLTAQPFFGTSAAGAPISITVYASEPLAKGYFDLVDSESGTVVRSGILSDQVVQLDNVDSFNLEAEFGDLEYDSIRYETSTGYTHTERYEPRPVCGNSGSTYNNCADLEGFKADFVLTAQAYSGELPVSELVTINVLVPDASSGSSATGYFPCELSFFVGAFDTNQLLHLDIRAEDHAIALSDDEWRPIKNMISSIVELNKIQLTDLSIDEIEYKYRSHNTLFRSRENLATITRKRES